MLTTTQMQLRRQTRLRREFLYKKEQEAREAATASRKQAAREAKGSAARASDARLAGKGKGKEVAGVMSSAGERGSRSCCSLAIHFLNPAF